MQDLNELAAMYDAAYWHGGSNYDGYGDDPGWPGTVLNLKAVVPDGGRMLELGCANGYFVRHARLAGFDCTGIDGSAYCVENSVAPVVLGDACDLSAVPDDSLDCLVSHEFLEHLPEDSARHLMTEMSRTVKQGGVLLHRIGLDLEGDSAWSVYPSPGEEDDPTHVLMRPRWWWEREFSRFSDPLRRTEDALNRTFKARDWWGRFFVRKVRKSSGWQFPHDGLFPDRDGRNG